MRRGSGRGWAPMQRTGRGSDRGFADEVPVLMRCQEDDVDD